MPRAPSLRAASLAAALTACAPPASDDAPMPSPLSTTARPPDEAARARLGARLFFDARLSSTREVSCASCHDITGGSGTTRTAVAYGVGRRAGARNPPTVWNAALRAALFWDGRAQSLEAQALGPLTNPDEMGMTREGVVRALAAVPGYRAEFAGAFASERAASGRDGIVLDEVLASLAAFERTLVTPDAPFDRACRGERGAISERARRGWSTFRELGCVACHAMPTFTGGDWYARFPLRAVPDLEFALGLTRDVGRGAVVTRPDAANTWRVPSLRNVAVTGPWFHNGSVASLDQAVRIMGRAQLARTLTDAQVSDLVAFLESLTGARPSVAAPPLPPDATP